MSNVMRLQCFGPVEGEQLPNFPVETLPCFAYWRRQWAWISHFTKNTGCSVSRLPRSSLYSSASVWSST